MHFPLEIFPHRFLANVVNGINGKSNNTHMKNHIKIITRLAIPLVLLAGIIGISLIKQPEIRLGEDLLEPTDTPDRSITPEQIERANLEMKSVRESCLKTLAEIEVSSVKRIDAIIKSHRAKVWSASTRAAAPFQGIRNTGHTGCLAAIDMATAQAERAGVANIKASNHLEKYTHDSMKPVLELVSGAIQKVRAEIDAHLAEITALRNRYQMETMQVLARHKLDHEGLGQAAIDSVIASFEASMKTAKLNRNVTVSTTLEAALIASTYKIIYRVLAHIAGKLAGTASAAVIAAAADGPLPIGDIIGAIIAVGGLTWTATDIYKANREQRALPGKIDHQTQLSLSDLRSAAIRTIQDSCLPDQIPPATLPLP